MERARERERERERDREREREREENREREIERDRQTEASTTHGSLSINDISEVQGLFCGDFGFRVQGLLRREGEGH